MLRSLVRERERHSSTTFVACIENEGAARCGSNEGSTCIRSSLYFFVSSRFVVLPLFLPWMRQSRRRHEAKGRGRSSSKMHGFGGMRDAVQERRNSREGELRKFFRVRKRNFASKQASHALLVGEPTRSAVAPGSLSLENRSVR